MLAQSVSTPVTTPTALSPMIITWIGLGLAIGFVGNSLLSRDVKASPANILVGLMATIAGGIIFRLINPNAMFLLNAGVAAIVGVVVLVVYHKFVRPALA